MMPARLDAIHLAILDRTKASPIPLKPLEGPVAPHTSLYRHAGQLRRWGFLTNPRKGVWAATEAGIRALEDARSGAPENPLDGRYPTLRLLPMPHRAIVRIGVLCAFAREHHLREAHHPSLLVAGDTMSFKTTSARVLACALGEDPTRAVVLTPSESGRSVSVRKTYGGKLASVRDALGWRFVAFDEYHKATPAVRTATVPYVMGQLEVPIENSVMSVRPVAMIVMNPLKGKTIVESTGFGPAELRRMIPLFVSSKDVPEDVRFRGEKIVEAAGKAGPIAMPTPAGVTVHAEDVAAILRPILTAEAEGLVDFETVAMACEAMASFASSGHVEFVIRDLLACYETVGWADPDWRVRIAALSHVPAPAAPVQAPTTEPTGKPVTVRDQTLAVLARAGHVLDRGLDYHVRVRDLEALLRGRGLDPAVVMNRAKVSLGWEKRGYPWPVLEALHPVYVKAGTADEFIRVIGSIVDRFGTFEKWEATLREQEAFLKRNGGSWDDVHEALLLRQILAESGVTLRDARDLLERILREGARDGKNASEAVTAMLNVYRSYRTLRVAVGVRSEELKNGETELASVRNARAEEERARNGDRARWEREQAERDHAVIAAREEEERKRAETRATWERERKAHEDEVASRTGRLEALDAKVAEKERTLTQLDAVITEKIERANESEKRAVEMEARADRLEAPLIAGEALYRAAATGKTKDLFGAADIVHRIHEHPGACPIRRSVEHLQRFEARVRAFVDHIGRPCVPLDERPPEIAEKVQTSERVAPEARRPPAGIAGEGEE